MFNVSIPPAVHTVFSTFYQADALLFSYNVRCSCIARSDGESDEDSDASSPPRQYSSRLAEMVGKVLLMTQDDRKKTIVVPVLVVQPNADSTELKTRDHLLVKSFKDSKL